MFLPNMQLRLSFSLLLLFFLTTATFAQPKANAQYVAQMKQGIGLLDKSMKVEQLRQAASFFNSMADEAPKDWLPPYYAAYCYTLMSFMEKQKVLKDNYLDQAQSHLDEAKKLSDKNVEITVVQAYIYQMRMQIDPAARMEEFGTLLQLTIEDAMALDANNPRIYYIQAQNAFFSVQGHGDACPMVQQAKEKYANFKPESDISPKWGAAMVDFMASVCEKTGGNAFNPTVKPEEKIEEK